MLHHHSTLRCATAFAAVCAIAAHRRVGAQRRYGVGVTDGRALRLALADAAPGATQSAVLLLPLPLLLPHCALSALLHHFSVHFHSTTFTSRFSPLYSLPPAARHYYRCCLLLIRRSFALSLAGAAPLQLLRCQFRPLYATLSAAAQDGRYRAAYHPPLPAAAASQQRCFIQFTASAALLYSTTYYSTSAAGLRARHRAL